MSALKVLSIPNLTSRTCSNVLEKLHGLEYLAIQYDNSPQDLTTIIIPATVRDIRSPMSLAQLTSLAPMARLELVGTIHELPGFNEHFTSIGTGLERLQITIGSYSVLRHLTRLLPGVSHWRVDLGSLKACAAYADDSHN
ncbi:hypothetical protein JAAARDRAFT_197866 [Jaapia argillacea MUCL 33604]|uniref:Uncharacterized protein n=1 Tax=Jaapia argillacea MUCL 33604 TaxID=933084 RepID=A0A067PGX8_9AGAM|nr:hypothetical protein JAAARDRAFT_197866 [Jaapia argillacea MUCL 33604]